MSMSSRYLIPILVLLLSIGVSLDASAVRKRTPKATPEWSAMSRGEHIAYLSLSPQTKPLIREYMQRETARFRSVCSEGVSTMRDSLIIKVELPISRFFTANDTIINSDGNKLLKSLLPPTRNDDYRVLVAVHTSNVGTPSYISYLSQVRADAIAGKLSAQAGGDAVIVSYGIGNKEPIAKNTSYQGRNSNRRVEILFIPSDVLVSKLTNQKKK